MRIRPLRAAIAAAALALVPAGLATADGGHEHGTGEYDTRGESDECVWKPAEPAYGAAGVEMEERTDAESGRRECVVFYNPSDPEGKTWGSWDPEMRDDPDDPNNPQDHEYYDPYDGSTYGPGDRSQRWAMSKEDERPAEGQKDATGADVHYGYHDPQCSDEAQAILLNEVRESLRRYNGVQGLKRASDEGYVIYPIGGKVWHAYNSALYDDYDPETGVQRDNDPWWPENIVYAMTDQRVHDGQVRDGWKAMGAMFAMKYAEDYGIDPVTGETWRWADLADAGRVVEPGDPPILTQADLPKWSTVITDPVTGAATTETCWMNWHTHAGQAGTATGGGVEGRAGRPPTSDPMSHVWAWGVDMWERGFDGSEYNAWWAPYRATPAICSEYDACL